MATDEPRRSVIKRLKKAGFELSRTDGRHEIWKHPSGPLIPVPRHTTISVGVVDKVNKIIRESEGRK
jgi:predicted RNA binding protein YcfA (HicA-like mRNA interferase family)